MFPGPLIVAPMAGGASTPALVASAAAHGSLGFLAAGYLTPTAFAEQIAAVRDRTDRPFGVNLFVITPGPTPPQSYADSLRPTAERFGVALGDPIWEDDHWAAKLEVVLTQRPAYCSFTFGCPEPAVLAALDQAGISSLITVTQLAEAQAAVAAGASALVIQGPAAGGHRGTWEVAPMPPDQPLLELLADITAAIDVPLVAGGGLSSAAQVREVLAAGADAAQVGTALLLADEAGTNPLHRAALSEFTETALTRAFTGRWARGLRNEFIDAHPDAPAGYPQVHHLTAPLRAAAVRAGAADVAHLWAGTGFRSARAAPAAEVLAELMP